MDKGHAPDPKDIEAVIKAATLTGDHMLLEQIGARIDRFDAMRVVGRASLATQEGAAAELAAGTITEGEWGLEEGAGMISPPVAGVLTPEQRAYLKNMQDLAQATRDGLKNDPIATVVQRFSDRYKMPAPFDLSSRDAAQTGLAERAAIARFGAANYGGAPIAALGQTDRTQIAGAIAGPDAKQTAIALDVLASLPDDNFAATLGHKEIKEAVSGAVRSNDPAKFTAAVMAADKMWARAPREFSNIFGEDVVKAVQDWQGKQRYMSAQELAETLNKRDDPQVRERKKAWLAAGRTEAANKTIKELTRELDPGWLEWGPDEPMDARTREAVLGDYTQLYAERYAETLDKGVAHDQTIERMLRYWKRSELNGGRLTLHAPETTYPAINGSHKWMRKQIVDDLRALGINMNDLSAAPPVRDEVMEMVTGREPNEFVVVADRNTESDIAARRPASYIIMMRNKAGEVEMVTAADGRPLRYWWDRDGGEARKAFETSQEYARQRKEVFKKVTPGVGPVAAGQY